MENSCDKVQSPRQTRLIGVTRRSVSGIYAFRGETAIQFESTLERDFIIRKEFCLTVLEVIPQPVQIPFVASNGQTYIYTPDFLVYYRLGNMGYGEYPKPLLEPGRLGDTLELVFEWNRHPNLINRNAILELTRIALQL